MKIKNLANLAGALFPFVIFISCVTLNEHKLFNGESLEGWERHNAGQRGAVVQMPMNIYG